MKIIIYGGSFNPPTLAHTAILKTCLELADVDEVWLMPSGERLDKQFLTTAQHRLDMLNLIKEDVFYNHPKLKIIDFEQKLPQPTQTWLSATALKTKYPNHEFWYVFGMDSYNDMHTWQDGHKVRDQLNHYLISRDGKVVPDLPNVRALSVKGLPVTSSTQVRQNIYNKQAFDHLVCGTVAKYIKHQRLYIDY